VRLVGSEAGEERRRQLWANIAAVSRKTDGPGSAIIPMMIGDEGNAMQIAAALMQQGVFIPAVRYPTVARGQARLRLTITAAHTRADVEQLLAALRALNLVANA
jgi:7-keto-8-aminopelargonate synthetase-like enzyme